MAQPASSVSGLELLAREDPWPLVKGVGSWKLWAAIGLLLALARWGGPGLVILLAHNGSEPGGAKLEMFESLATVRPAALETQAPDTSGVPLPLPQTQLLLTGCWFVANAGSYRLQFHCDDWGHVEVDGKKVVVLPRDVRGGVTRESEVELEAGWHVLSIHASNLLKKGSMALLVGGPDGGALQPVGGDSLRSCSPFWVTALAVTRSLDRVLLLVLAAAAGLLLLSRFASREACAVVGTCLVILVPAAALTARASKEPLAHPEWNAALKSKDPDWVFVGNSMMPCRIDQARLKALTGGEAHVLRLPGTRTAAWYLALKNHVVASGVKPKATFLFFRDHWLTLPSLKASGQRSLLEGLSPGDVFDEPLIDELAFGEAAFQRGASDALQWAFPTMSWHSELHHLPSAYAVNWTLAQSEWFSGESATDPRGKRAMELRGALNDRFALERLKGQEDLSGEPINLGMGAGERTLMDADASFDFDSMNSKSFLPEFVRMAGEHDLNLVLVRLRRRPTVDNHPEHDERLDRYLEDLARWLKEKRVPYYDLTEEAGLTLDWYGQGDHIAPSHTTRYTELFHKRLKSTFEGER